MVAVTGLNNGGVEVEILTNNSVCEEFIGEDIDNVSAVPAVFTRWIESPSNADVGIRISFHKTFAHNENGIRLMVFADNRKIACTTIRSSFLQARWLEGDVWQKLMESVQRKRNGQVCVQKFIFSDVNIDNTANPNGTENSADGDNDGNESLFVNNDVEYERERFRDPTPESDDGQDNADNNVKPAVGLGTISVYMWRMEWVKKSRRAKAYAGLPKGYPQKPMVSDTTEPSGLGVSRTEVNTKGLTHMFDFAPPINTTYQASTKHTDGPRITKPKRKPQDFTWKFENKAKRPFAEVHFKYRSLDKLAQNGEVDMST